MARCMKENELYICEDFESYGYELCPLGKEAQEAEDGNTVCAFRKIRETDGKTVCTCAKAKITEDKRQELINHFEYDVMNSWNRLTSFGANVKVYNVVPKEYLDAAYSLIETRQFYEWYLNPIMEDFERAINKISSKMGIETEVGMNGRSGGYLVMSLRKMAGCIIISMR